MTKEQLQAFAEAVSKSEELQKEYISIQLELTRSNAEKVAKLSQSTDTPFTAQEYLEAVADSSDSSDEMSPEQLHAVAGGVFAPTVGNVVGSILTLGIGCAVLAIHTALMKLPANACRFSSHTGPNLG